MSHAAVYGEVLFWFVVVLTLLLAMFIGVVIRTPSGTVGSPPPELTPPAPPPPMLVRWPEDAGLAGAAVQSARTGYQPRHAGGLKPELVVAGRLPASGCPPWGPAPKPPGPGLPHARSASCAANMTGPGPARRRSASIAVASTPSGGQAGAHRRARRHGAHRARIGTGQARRSHGRTGRHRAAVRYGGVGVIGGRHEAQVRDP